MAEFYKKTIEQGQDVFDLALQEYGSVEAAVMFLFDNGLELATPLVVGTQYRFRQVPPDGTMPDGQVMDFFRRNIIRVNNG